MHALPDDALVPFPTVGRVYRQQLRVTHGDVTPLGRSRLDAIASWLQHLAFCDVVDAGVAHDAAWIARRTRIRIERFPRFGEVLELRTACSGASGLSAEWRTAIRGEHGAVVEAATLWVSVDPVSWRPRPNPAEMRAVFGPSTEGRRVRVRLTHPPVPDDASRSGWHFRTADLDIAGHVNNAAYWQAVEEDLRDLSPDALLEAEIEHHDATGAGPAVVRRSGDRTWIEDPAGRCCSSFLVRPIGPAAPPSPTTS
ncbi:acyl-ACP thioesterase domain-containing protein [Patulibacter defluvii]|uniref:acyl-ACP thioesterase domain-containing protein n=1 Tax=Patulibacter defluvii TaxID=3095358 RepID=UPI002A75CAF4|nr:acyl-ACP thioesterase domain-containing protein [Patulibacter sp. DM4]